MFQKIARHAAHAADMVLPGTQNNLSEKLYKRQYTKAYKKASEEMTLTPDVHAAIQAGAQNLGALLPYV